MESAVEKEKWNFTELVSQYGDGLYRYALLRTGQRELAEDLVQETFLSAVVKIDTYRGEASIDSWLRAILRNKLIDLIRSKSFKESPAESSDFFNEWGIWNNPISKWFQWQESPEDSLQRAGFFKAMQGCLAKLPVKQRAVISLRAFDGLTTESICKELKISTSNEWVITYRARLGLRECLEKTGFKKNELEY